jgi:Flp pilus assembly protein TadD
MRSRLLGFLVLLLTWSAGGGAALHAQQAAAPLTEREITYLLEKKVSSSALAEMVQSYGVAFQADEGIFNRLKKAGASEALLDTIRKHAKSRELQIEVVRPAPPPPEPEPVPAPAREHLRLGQQKLKNYDYEGALREFAEAERIMPQWDQIFKQRGLAFEALGRYSEAASEWKQYQAIASTDVNKAAIQQKITEWEGEASRVNKTRALLTKGDQQLQGDDAKGATQSFRDAVALSSSVGALLALARAQLQDGDYAGLAKTARQARTLDPQSALAALYLADSELRQGNSGSPALDQGLNFNPNLVYGRALLAREFRQKAARAGGHREAPAGAANSASAEERDRRGWVLWNGGYFQQAIEELQKATLLNPTDDGWQCDLSYARLAQRDTAGASAAAREAIRLNSESVCGHHALALSLEKMGQREQSAQEFRAAEKLSSAWGMAGLLRPGLKVGSTSENRN